MNQSIKSTITALLILLTINACSDNPSNSEELSSDLEVIEIQDLNATGDSGHYTFFNLSTGEEVPFADSASGDWDIAFLSTTIIFNGGTSGPGDAAALDLDIDFGQVELAPTEGYRQDSENGFAITTGSGNGWYTYTGQGTPPLAILPRQNYTIVMKTADGENYAKLEILSYYEGNPDTSSDEFANLQTRSASRFYTFRYALQQTAGLRELK